MKEGLVLERRLAFLAGALLSSQLSVSMQQGFMV